MFFKSEIHINWFAGRILFFGMLGLFSISAFSQSKKGKADADKMREAETIYFDACRQDILENQKEALALFFKSLELNPENAAASYKVADLLIKENKPEEALKFAEKAVSLVKDNEYYWVQLSMLQEITGNWKGAIESYEEMVKRFENGKRYRLNIAQLYIKNKKAKNAIKELEKVEKELGPSPEIFQTRQRLYMIEGKNSQAEEECKKWIQTFPEDDQAKMNFAQYLIEQKKYQEAKKQLIELLERDNGFASAHLMLANIYLLENDEKNADLEVEKAIQSPDLPLGAKIDLVGGFLRGMESKEEEEKALRFSDLIIKSHPESSQAIILKGDLLNKTGNKKEARNYYIKAKGLDKNNFALWEQLVLLDLNLNELDSVQKHTAEARILFPNTALFAFYNGLSNLMLKDYEKSVEALEQAKRLSVGNKEMQLEVFSQLGDAYYNLKDPEKSFAAFDEVLKMDSNNVHVLNNYAYFLSLEKTNLAKALKMSFRLIKLQPNDPTFLDTHGWVLYQKGNYAEALIALEKSAMDSNSGTIWEHFGDALFQNGKTEKALEAWKKAKELGGEFSEQLEKKLKDKRLP